jgi:NADPH:quinone reductase-like Zn-dependent oxidoreductase
MIGLTGITLRALVAKPSSEDLQFLRGLIEAGSVTPIIDRTYPLSESNDAIRYVETGRARGKVVISVSARTNGHVEGALAMDEEALA